MCEVSSEAGGDQERATKRALPSSGHAVETEVPGGRPHPRPRQFTINSGSSDSNAKQDSHRAVPSPGPLTFSTVLTLGSSPGPVPTEYMLPLSHTLNP